jgi:hypothetical protein
LKATPMIPNTMSNAGLSADEIDVLGLFFLA